MKFTNVKKLFIKFIGEGSNIKFPTKYLKYVIVNGDTEDSPTPGPTPGPEPEPQPSNWNYKLLYDTAGYNNYNFPRVFDEENAHLSEYNDEIPINGSIDELDEFINSFNGINTLVTNKNVKLIIGANVEPQELQAFSVAYHKISDFEFSEGITEMGGNNAFKFYFTDFVPDMTFNIPHSVTKLNENVFEAYGSKNLINKVIITYNGTQEEWNNIEKPASLSDVFKYNMSPYDANSGIKVYSKDGVLLYDSVA